MMMVVCEASLERALWMLSLGDQTCLVCAHQNWIAHMV